jgi:hypothetical protein
MKEKEFKCGDCGVKLASNKQRCQLCNESLLEFLENFDIEFALKEERECNAEWA